MPSLRFFLNDTIFPLPNSPSWPIFLVFIFCPHLQQVFSYGHFHFVFKPFSICSAILAVFVRFVSDASIAVSCDLSSLLSRPGIETASCSLLYSFISSFLYKSPVGWVFGVTPRAPYNNPPRSPKTCRYLLFWTGWPHMYTEEHNSPVQWFNSRSSQYRVSDHLFSLAVVLLGRLILLLFSVCCPFLLTVRGTQALALLCRVSSPNGCSFTSPTPPFIETFSLSSLNNRTQATY